MKRIFWLVAILLFVETVSAGEVTVAFGSDNWAQWLIDGTGGGT